MRAGRGAPCDRCRAPEITCAEASRAGPSPTIIHGEPKKRRGLRPDPQAPPPPAGSGCDLAAAEGCVRGAGSSSEVPDGLEKPTANLAEDASEGRRARRCRRAVSPGSTARLALRAQIAKRSRGRRDPSRTGRRRAAAPAGAPESRNSQARVQTCGGPRKPLGLRAAPVGMSSADQQLKGSTHEYAIRSCYRDRRGCGPTDEARATPSAAVIAQRSPPLLTSQRFCASWTAGHAVTSAPSRPRRSDTRCTRRSGTVSFRLSRRRMTRSRPRISRVFGETHGGTSAEICHTIARWCKTAGVESDT